MYKKLLVWIVGFLFLFSFKVVSANVVITEIMYDNEGTDTGREWIEVFNDGSTAIDLSTYKLFEADTNHGLTVAFGNKNLSVGAYAIIVSDYSKFKIDWPNISGSIFDSTFSLNNDTEAIAIKDNNLNISDQYTYLSSIGGGGDGKSLQKINGVWSVSNPTPGVINILVTTLSSDTNSNSDTNSTNTNADSNSTNFNNVSSPLVSKIKTSISNDLVLFANIPSVFKAETKGYNNEKLIYGKYIWNFGDGFNLETKVNSTEVLTHTYFYPGEYVLTLEYYSSYYSSEPDTVSQRTLQVVASPISISKIGEEKDFFVELSNVSGFDIDISNWKLLFGMQQFTFPKNSFILANQKLILSPSITKFVFSNSKDFLLLNNFSNQVFDYLSLSNKTKNTQSKINNNYAILSVIKNVDSSYENNSNLSVLNSINKHPDFPLNVLGARAINGVDNLEIKHSGWIFIIALIGIVGLGVFFVFFIRKNKNFNETEDDFEILEE